MMLSIMWCWEEEISAGIPGFYTYRPPLMPNDPITKVGIGTGYHPRSPRVGIIDRIRGRGRIETSTPGVQPACDGYRISELRGMRGTENHFRK